MNLFDNSVTNAYCVKFANEIFLSFQIPRLRDIYISVLFLHNDCHISVRRL